MIALSRAHDPSFLVALSVIQVIFVSPLLHLWVMRWVAGKLGLSTGQTLHFDGSYLECLGFQFLLGLSGISIIGWAWVVAWYYDWVAENTHGEAIAFRCEASGWEILWRNVVATLGCIPLVTIPWMKMWYARWLVSCVSMTLGVTAVDQDWA